MPVDEQPGLDLIEDAILEGLRDMRLQCVERIPVHGADEQLGQPDHVAELSRDQVRHAFLELGGGLLGEGESHDVVRLHVRTAQDLHDPL